MNTTITAEVSNGGLDGTESSLDVASTHTHISASSSGRVSINTNLFFTT
jgi:hypothetical protein